MKNFCVCFYKTTTNTPNVGDITNNEALNNYMKSFVVCCSLIKRSFAETASFTLFVNFNINNQYKQQIEALGGKVTVLAENLKYVESKERQVFPGCLYTLDVINYLAKVNSDNAQYIFVDSDWLCIKQFESKGIEGIKLDYPNNQIINGWTVSELKKIANCEQFNYYGGEYYSLSHKAIKSIAKDIENFWQITQPRRVTEEHILSLVLNNKKYNVHLSNKKMARIWTTPSLYQFTPAFKNLAAVHMPAEKNKLIPLLYEKAFSESFNVSDFISINVTKHPKWKLIAGRFYRFFLNMKF
jgi:hypothetical protein